MHREAHRSDRAAWLRAAVLGADDGIVSTASLMIGVASSAAPKGAILVAGLAGLVAGAMSMAAGEYVSVSSQRDTERADINREAGELFANPGHELRELSEIYVRRGLDPELARTVAEKLMRADALGSHVRDELGFTETSMARPLQAATASAVSFALGAGLPLAALLIAPEQGRIAAIAASALALLGALGAGGAWLGGASPTRGALRVLVGGGLAMLVTALIGRLVGAAV